MQRFNMRLAAFLIKSGMKKKELAVEIGVSPQAITEWLTRRRKIRRCNAETLVNFTNGYITMKDCGY